MRAALAGGFPDAPRDSARAFRAVLDAMAHPGRIVTLTGAAPPEPLGLAAAVVLLTLCDAGTPLWLAPTLDTPALRGWIAFHSGAVPVADRAAAAFGFGGWAELMPVTGWAAGTPDYPDRSATLIAELPALVAEGSLLTGPGIAGAARLNLPDPGALRANAARFPLGVDLIFTAGDRLAALPRSTRIGE